MSKLQTLGWDIGGAHLKAALLDVDGELLGTLQVACPLWRGLDNLAAAIDTVLKTFKMNPHHAKHAITMTGELVDLFPNRHEGVIEIAQFVKRLLGHQCQFYSANKGFIYIEQVAESTEYIASTNWHASASLIALYCTDALLVDIGSTTSDIIKIESGKVSSAALSDASRLQQDTLVYTGVVRTPVMALAQKLPLEGVETNVMAEYFATMADVYRLTGELDVAADMAETADGKGKSLQESARRLARMVGYDLEDKAMDVWVQLAFSCRLAQLMQLKAAVLKHMKPNVALIGAGAGSFLVKALADELKAPYLSVNAILASNMHTKFENSQAFEVCFPAYAVAHLSIKASPQ
ncbi:MAG: hydantoinase/oxoprolinase family protein [Pseudomonadota bacterium]